MIALSIQEGVPDPFQKIKEFRKAHQVTYPILSDEKAAVMQKFGFDAIPANVILDGQGKYIANPEGVSEIISVLEKRSGH